MKMPQLWLHLIMLPMNIRDSLFALRAFKIDNTYGRNHGNDMVSRLRSEHEETLAVHTDHGYRKYVDLKR